MRYNLFSRAVKLLNQNQNRSHKLFIWRAVSSNTTNIKRNSLNVEQQRTDNKQAAEEFITENDQQLPAREPLAKNFFVGATDRELLGYPEVIPREEMSQLQKVLLPLNNYFGEHPAGEEGQKHTIDNLRQLGLYGFNVPAEYDGKGYKWSASLMASEPESAHTSLALGLQSHRVVVDLIRELGTPAQQQRYLTALGSGQLIASEAIFEYTAHEDEFFGTQSTFESTKKTWTLDGEKAFVVAAPAGTPQLFLVLAQTQQPSMAGPIGRGSTFFLVESQQSGVRLGERHATFGCRDAPMHYLHFDNVQLTEENVLGIPHEGNMHSELMVRASRLRSSLLGISLSKQLLSQLANFSVNTTQCGVRINDLELTRVQLSETMCSIYAMESMLYLTAGLLDEFAGQDVTLESAITKYYTLQQLYTISTQSLSLLGPHSLHSGQPAELVLRDATQLCTQGESMSTLSLFIALTGLHHAGQLMNAGVRKSRNPLYHPGHIFGKFLSTSSLEQPKTRMQLAENVHPTLEAAAQCIEHSVARLHMSVDLLFTKHGNDIVECQNQLERLANIASIIYAMWASIARASRSYCIGLPLADHELLTASAICSQGRDDVMRIATQIANGKHINNDNNLLRLAPQVAKSKGYFAVHPLTFNF